MTVVEKGPMLGCGVAYATADPSHLLNARVASTSAYPDLPDHFADWLRTQGHADVDLQGFVTRGTYGRYVACLLDPWAGSPRLRLVRSEGVGLDIGRARVAARLAGGRAIKADVAALTTGHALPAPGQDPDLTPPWAGASPLCGGPGLIVGSGLTMVDQVPSLMAAGHPGPITVVPRRGLPPQVQAPTDPVRRSAAELPCKGAAEVGP